MQEALEKASQKNVYLQSLVDKHVWLLINISFITAGPLLEPSLQGNWSSVITKANLQENLGQADATHSRL